MNTVVLNGNTFSNFFQTVLVLLALTTIMTAMGWIVAGYSGILMAAAAAVLTLAGAP